MTKRALISVSDKTGIVDFAKALVAEGVEVLSTGGTMRLLKEHNIPVRAVSDVTGFPEMMGGRVKTLHPKVHGGILALRDNEEHVKDMKAHDIAPIDMVVVNLYPFRETIAKEGVTLPEAIEQIDIGGPTMIRSAAKNNRFVSVVVDPSDYDMIIKAISSEDGITEAMRLGLAKKAFAHTATYDSFIAKYLSEQVGEGIFPNTYIPVYEKVQDLRYGENPHQKAAFYKDAGRNCGLGAMKQLHGKALSYNNLVDMESAWNMVWEFEEPAVCIIKHTNPCGAARANTISEAYRKAFAADDVSAFGGIVSLNREVDEATAEQMSKVFLEVIMAPAFSQKALDILTAKKNIRLITLERPQANQLSVKKLSGGLLVQEEDQIIEDSAEYKVVTETEPTAEEWEALKFAWKMVKHVKSNAILVANSESTLGVGAGQMNRVGSANIALEQAGEKAKGSVMASDAFFPFGDTIELAAKYGIRAVIQPGGSIRDQESIDMANKYGIAMVFTGIRHFKH